ncbi:MAG: Uma2 family endonuclease [Bryobacterales bacterium]|nr:Uma2 family endonuclease [Bryobacterales bacterium]MDE0265389.1 Uma2 family endonuclease [Bryobacterales bacterium]
MPVPVEAVRRATRPPEVQLEEYPFSDGRVLMETDPHANSIVAMRNQLQWHFEARPDVYVAGSMAVFWRQGDPSAVVAPDVFVVIGTAKGDRQSYRTWDEGGIVPAFVIEVASGSTSRRDETGKRETYEQMGVREYWRFDPTEKWIAQGLVGWRLAGGRYERVREEAEGGRYRSEALGLELRAERWLLRFRDPIVGRDLLTHSEFGRALQNAERERDAAERRAETEAASRLQAERERDEANRRIQELEARLRLSR